MDLKSGVEIENKKRRWYNDLQQLSLYHFESMLFLKFFKLHFNVRPTDLSRHPRGGGICNKVVGYISQRSAYFAIPASEDGDVICSELVVV